VSDTLDASALLAYLHGEAGAERVAEAIAEGAIISSANLAEVLTKRADAGDHPAAVAARLVENGLLGGALAVVDLNFDDAVEIAKLRGSIRSVGLSLGDPGVPGAGEALRGPCADGGRGVGQARHRSEGGDHPLGH